MNWFQRIFASEAHEAVAPKTPFAVVFPCPHCEKELAWGGRAEVQGGGARARFDVSRVPIAEAIELLAHSGRHMTCGHCRGAIRLDVTAQVKVVGIDRAPNRTTVI